MTTQTFYRRADVPKAKAVESLLAAYPNSTIVRVDAKKASPAEARFAGTRPGARIFEAVIRTAEEGEEGILDLSKGEDEGGEEESKAPDFGGESEDEGGESESEEKSEGDEGESKDESKDEGDPLGLGDIEAPEELKGEDKIIDLLQQLVDAVAGGASLGPKKGPGPEGLGPEGPGAGPPDSMVLPDIGAPAPGGGPGAPGKGPLPPPVEPKKSPASFAKIVAVRRDVDGSVDTRDLIREAQANWPSHRVAQVKRNGIGVIKGVNVDLPAHNIALVTLVKK